MSGRALVTGASGLVGSHLVDLLVESGTRHIRVLARKTSNLKWIEGVPFEKHIGDVTQPWQELVPAVDGMDVVYHVAGATKALHPRTFFEVNERGTRNLLEACVNLKEPPGRFVLVSSAGAQGPSPTDEPLRETDEPRPVTQYGRSKLAAERAAHEYMNRLSIAIVRPGAIYGPREMELYPAFRSVQRGLTVKLGASRRRFNLGHVRDVAKGIQLAGTVEAAGGETFLIGGPNVDQGEFARAIAKALGKKRFLSPAVPKPFIYFAALLSSLVGQITRKPRIFIWGNARRLLAKNWTFDLEKAQNILGYRPEYNLDSGVRDTVDWYRFVNLL
jgi:dihydroflavonol-4-reductase